MPQKRFNSPYSIFVISGASNSFSFFNTTSILIAKKKLKAKISKIIFKPCSKITL